MRKPSGKLGRVMVGPLLQAATLLLLLSAAVCHAQIDCVWNSNAGQTISSISPSTWIAGKTTTVTLTGTNLCGDYVWVAVDSGSVTVQLLSVTSSTETQFTATPDASDPTETATVWVRFLDGGDFPPTSATVQIIGCATPTIASVTPSTWFAGKTYDKVTITGTNFTTNDDAAKTGCPVTPIAVTTGTGSVTVSNVHVDSKTKITATVAPDDSDPTETATVTAGPTPASSSTQTYTAQILSDTCKAALATANKSQAAVTRAENAWSVLQTAAEAHDIDPALLAAIGVRETGFMNIQEYNGGPGMGVFQLTNQPGVTAAEAYNLTFAANYAANMLSNNENILSNEFPAFTPDQLLQATAASYNIGTDPNTGISGNPNTIDVGTAPGGIHGNYGSNVVGLMSCFQQP